MLCYSKPILRTYFWETVLAEPAKNRYPLSMSLIAEVAVPRPIDRTFDYSISDHLGSPSIGVRVRVIFGRDKVVGYLLGLKQESDFEGKLQPLLEVLDDDPILTPESLKLAAWMRDYYLCPIGLVLQAMLPIRLQRAKPSRTKIVELQTDLSQTLRAIEQLRQEAPQQAKLLEALLQNSNPLVKDLLNWTKSSQGPLRSLLDKGWIKLLPKPLEGFQTTFHEKAKDIVLTEAQLNVVNTIGTSLDNRKGAFLLHGVNGSGKTEVYLHAIAEAQKRGFTSMLMVSEISLTAQVIARFRHRLGDGLAILHSGLTDAQRASEWTRLREGEAQVVLGVRSASLVPMENLGLIIMDEEHESTYQQDSPDPRYHARQVSLQRHQLEQTVVVLGSGTPSLTTYHQANKGTLTSLTLPRLVSDKPPDIEVVDISQQRSWCSELLDEALRDILSQGKQAMLFLNRRGFGIAFCKGCRRTQRCPDCDISLVFEAKSVQLRCHYCDHMQTANECQHCGNEVQMIGAGTQRVELSLKRKFETARITRMDSDTIKKGQHGAVLEKFRQGEIDILLGTQMIGVGHDFPNVSLMGIIDADTLLDVPDYRAAERTYQLLSQAAGRAGRGDQPARVILQTRHPDHYVIQHAAKHDFKAFAEEELSFREALQYPPFGELITMLVSHKAEEKLEGVVDQLKQALLSQQLEALGPSKAMPYKWRNAYRTKLLLKLEDAQAVKPLLVSIIKNLGIETHVKFEIDN